MLEKFWENTVKMLFIKGAMDAIPTFRPLGKTPAQVQALLDERETVRGEHVAAHTGLQMGQGAVSSAGEEARRETVRAYALMKSTYADDADQLHVIVRIPKKCWTPRDVVMRMMKTSAAWEDLPNPPGSATPFESNGLTREEFDDLRDDLEAKVKSCAHCKRDYDRAKAATARVERAQRNFITRALTLGRAQFDPGTPERGIIDGIPTEPSTQAPGVVEFDTVESTGAGEIFLKFAADHATAFRIEHKGPGDTAWTTVATLPATDNGAQYTASGLAAGMHQYRVYGANSRGEGPASAVQSIEVAAEAAA